MFLNGNVASTSVCVFGIGVLPEDTAQITFLSLQADEYQPQTDVARNSRFSSTQHIQQMAL